MFLCRSGQSAAAGNTAGLIMVLGILLLFLPTDLPYGGIAHWVCLVVDLPIILYVFWLGLFCRDGTGPPGGDSPSKFL